MTDSDSLSGADSATDQIVRWLLLSGNRLAVAVALNSIIFVIFLVFGFAGIVTFGIPNRMNWFMNGVINGLLTLIPVAIGINQIVLSQELGSLDDLYDRTEGTTDFRQDVADLLGISVTSPEAPGFFYELISGINDRSVTIRQVCDGSVDEQLEDDTDNFVEPLIDQTDAVMDQLDEIELDLFKTLLILLDYHNSRQFYATRRLQTAYDDGDIPETAREKLSELEDLFLVLDASRDYLKTLWIQRELAELSRMLLYTGIPAVLTAAILIFSYRDISGIQVPQPLLVTVVSAVIAVVLLPLSVLLSYIGRVALVVQRTAAFGPFIPQAEQKRIEQEGSGAQRSED